MNTKTGAGLAGGRHQFLLQFAARIQKEAAWQKAKRGNRTLVQAVLE
ncbi:MULTISPECIES: hypothetical protein [Bacillus]|nr:MULTISPECIES: hypothetical protein [Bacillus]